MELLQRESIQHLNLFNDDKIITKSEVSQNFNENEKLDFVKHVSSSIFFINVLFVY